MSVNAKDTEIPGLPDEIPGVRLIGPFQPPGEWADYVMSLCCDLSQKEPDLMTNLLRYLCSLPFAREPVVHEHRMWQPRQMNTLLRANVANIEAFLIQTVGDVAEFPCVQCANQFGPMVLCVSLPDTPSAVSCANCHFGGLGSRCSFNPSPSAPSPIKIDEAYGQGASAPRGTAIDLLLGKRAEIAHNLEEREHVEYNLRETLASMQETLKALRRTINEMHRGIAHDHAHAASIDNAIEAFYQQAEQDTDLQITNLAPEGNSLF
ncbi:hypothetical protein N7457_006471 [Penicillium paradoxum]|uniref:uncharacterized protein n=1 Tax=Penicillium paradoxum TaxID=176176 RepID=UPI002549B820|nr:uncharacterized protein N7457_006471 [Penicillium paradoxum]KAJ5781311.1 hypothetical protein N7457_006471 [Penicillium paradoxum]